MIRRMSQQGLGTVKAKNEINRNKSQELHVPREPEFETIQPLKDPQENNQTVEQAQVLPNSCSLAPSLSQKVI